MLFRSAGDQLTASVHEFSENEGVLCSSSIAGLNHSLEVNKVFYTVPVARNSHSNLFGDIKYQDDTQKLVIEVTIDDIPYFYIISLYELNAGMIYKIGNINLKSIGSEYSNKYEQKYEVKGAVTEIADWSETELAKMNVGYTVDGYDIYGYE